MAEGMVRCSRCFQVFEADESSCPVCGTPYQPPVPQPKAHEGLYVERYAGTEFLPLPAAAPPAPRRHGTRLWIGGGVALIVAAVFVAILFELGGVGGNGPTQAPLIFSAVTPSPSPTPTLPPGIVSTVAQLEDPNLSANVTVDSRVQLSSKVLGHAQSIAVSFDGQVSGGNQQGTLTAFGTSQELRLVDGQVYQRILPAGKWKAIASLSAYLVICPLFSVDSAQDLQLVGQEMRDGQLLNHFQSTGWWNPDLSRMAMTDLSGIPIKPDRVLLDVWSTAAGAPVEATFSGINSATDGTKLLDIEVSYTFSEVGVPQAIGSPGPSPKASPSSAAPPSQ